MMVVDDSVDPLPLGGDDSPWAHDVPAGPPPVLPPSWSKRNAELHDDSSSTPVDLSHGGRADHSVVASGEGLGDRGPPRRRWPIALVLAAGVAVGVVAAHVGRSGDSERIGDPIAVKNDPMVERPTEVSVDSTVTSGGPSTRPLTNVAHTLPEPEPQWVAAPPIELSPRLQAMTVPTELIALNSDGTLLSIPIPTGAVHSIETQEGGMDVGMAVSDSSVLLYAYDGWFAKLVQMWDAGGSTVEVDVGDGIADAVAVPGTDQFIVQPAPTPDETPHRLMLYPYGTTRVIDRGPIAELDLWKVRFESSTGDMLIAETGGTYVVGGDDVVRRVSAGDLIAVGQNHFLVRECDATLVCGYVRVDAGSGDRVALSSSERLDALGPFDNAAALSPDGSALTYIDWEGTPATIRLVDIITGDDAEVGPVDHSGYNYRTVWAADSSGIFLGEQGELVFFDRVTEQRVAVFASADLGVIMAISAHPAAADHP